MMMVFIEETFSLKSVFEKDLYAKNLIIWRDKIQNYK